MTAAELNAIGTDAVSRTARFELLTNQAETSGVVFDYNTPVPPMPHYRPREWETDTKEQQ